MRFEGPSQEGTFLDSPKGPTVVEVQQAVCDALTEELPNETLAGTERWFCCHTVRFRHGKVLPSGVQPVRVDAKVRSGMLIQSLVRIQV